MAPGILFSQNSSNVLKTLSTARDQSFRNDVVLFQVVFLEIKSPYSDGMFLGLCIVAIDNLHIAELDNLSLSRYSWFED